MATKDTDIVSKIDAVVEDSSKTRRNMPSMDMGAGGYDSEFSALQDMTQGPVPMSAARAGVSEEAVRMYLRSRRDGKARTKASIEAGIRVAQGRDIEQALKGAGYNPLSDEDFTLEEPTPESVAEDILSITVKGADDLRSIAGKMFELSEIARTDSEAVNIGKKLKEDIDKACAEVLDGRDSARFLSESSVKLVRLDEQAGEFFVDEMLEDYHPKNAKQVSRALTAIIEGAFDEGLIEGASIHFEDIMEHSDPSQDSAVAYGFDGDGEPIAVGVVSEDGNIKVMIEHVKNRSHLRATGTDTTSLCKAILNSVPALFEQDMSRRIDLTSKED